MLLDSASTPHLESVARPDDRADDVAPSAALTEGDFAAGVRQRSGHPACRGSFATGISSPFGQPTQTSGDFAAGRRAQACTAVIGNFATGMREQRTGQPAVAAQVSRSQSDAAPAHRAA